MSDTNLSRRRFLRNLTVAVPVSTLVLHGTAMAQDTPKLTEDDPTAMALGYVDDATKTDAAKWANYKAGQDCANCSQIQGADGDVWRPCGIFPGKVVNAKGWCSVWAPKA
jgi:hypothetical protein